MTPRMIGMKAYICYYLLSEKQYKSLFGSVHLNLYSDILFVDLLSNNDSSLNLLLDVSDFKTRLSEAWEVARSSLKSAQS